MTLQVTSTRFPDVLVLQPSVFADERGAFFESYNQRTLDEILGRAVTFVQDNHSISHRNVIRGLHLQCRPCGQDKLVRVLRGEIFDVVVDVRRDSASFGQWTGINLSAENRRQIWIPAGFAHGFLALSDDAEVLYKVTHAYSPAHEACIQWDDPQIAIDWPLDGLPCLSVKDRTGAKMADFGSY